MNDDTINPEALEAEERGGRMIGWTRIKDGLPNCGVDLLVHYVCGDVRSAVFHGDAFYEDNGERYEPEYVNRWITVEDLLKLLPDATEAEQYFIAEAHTADILASLEKTSNEMPEIRPKVLYATVELDPRILRNEDVVEEFCRIAKREYEKEAQRMAEILYSPTEEP